MTLIVISYLYYHGGRYPYSCITAEQIEFQQNSHQSHVSVDHLSSLFLTGLYLMKADVKKAYTVPIHSDDQPLLGFVGGFDIYWLHLHFALKIFTAVADAFQWILYSQTGNTQAGLLLTYNYICGRVLWRGWGQQILLVDSWESHQNFRAPQFAYRNWSWHSFIFPTRSFWNKVNPIKCCDL